MKRARGYALIVALAVLFVLLTLALALFHSRGAMSNLVAMNRRYLAQGILAQNTTTRLEMMLQGVDPGPGDRISLQQDFRVQQNGYQATVTWREGSGSVRGREVRDPKLGTKLFKPPSEWDELPQVGYQPKLAVKALGGVDVAPAHLALGLDYTGGARYLAMYDRAFPFAAYAPNGGVYLDRVEAFTNPTYAEGHNETNSGLPIWLLARDQVFVSDCAYGRAWSRQGPVNVVGGMVGLVGPLPTDRLGPELAANSQSAMSALSRDTLDKTGALVGHLLTVQNFVDLFNDPRKVVPIVLRGLSLQQATMVPLLPIPTIQKAGVVVVQIHHPWPPDFGKRDDAPELSQRLRQLSQDETRLGKESNDLYEDIIKLRRKIMLNPQSPEVPTWRSQITKKTDARLLVEDERKKVSDEFHRVRRQLEQGAWERGAIRGQAPKNWWHELDYNTVGWTYLGVVEQFVKSLGDLVEGKDWTHFMGRMATLTRVVHLGWDDPAFYFPDGQPNVRDGDPVQRPGFVPSDTLSMKSTVTVPPGRTLRLRTNVQVRGDLWIERGASLYVQGNLEVRAPESWRDFNGLALQWEDPLYPKGRLFMEEGASLVVDGDVTCSGGLPETGSVIVTGPVGRVNGVSSAILCKGNFSTAYGIQPGATLIDYLQARSKEKEYLRGWVDFFWGLSYVAPSVARVAGPFTLRMPWFSRFTTTFVIPPKPPIPIPVPLPLPNCYRTWFVLLGGATMVQLNLRLGPTFSTMSWPLWIFGRGVVPVLNKVNPDLLWPRIDAFRYQAPKIVDEIIGPALLEAIKEVIKGALLELVVRIFTRMVESIVKSVIPFNPVQCLGFEWDSEGTKPPPLVKKFLEDLVGGAVSGSISLVNALAAIVKQELTRTMIAPPEDRAREMAGLYVYSGGTMTIGRTSQSTPLASGFFVSGMNLRCNAALTVGALVSLQGRVQAHDLFYYPYFTQVNLYNPLKPNRYLGNDKPSDYFPLDEMQDLLYPPVVIPVNEEPPLHLGGAYYRMVARGWMR